MVGSLKLFGFSMARKVLSWSVKVLHFFQEFTEVRRDSICFAPKILKCSLWFSHLRGTEKDSKTRTCSTKFYRLLEASIGFINVLFSMRFDQVPQGSTRFHQVPQWSKGSIGIPLGSNMVPQGFIRHHEILKCITWL